MDSLTFTVTPRGSDQTITIDLSALLTQLQTVPDSAQAARHALPVGRVVSHRRGDEIVWG